MDTNNTNDTKPVAQTYSASLLATWWAMFTAEYALSQPDFNPETDKAQIPPDKVILHFMGCGASCSVRAGDIDLALQSIANLKAQPFFVGNYYTTKNGKYVKIVQARVDQGIILGDDGIWRYNTEAFGMGRVTGSDHDMSNDNNLTPLYTLG